MKISVITATSNSATTLLDTIDSVLAQTYTDIEHVIVDGASNDGTIELIRQCEPLYQGRLRWVSEPDGGIYDAMNKGIAMATGDVIGFLNSDDFYTGSTVVERVAQALAASDADAVYGDVHYVSRKDLSKCLRHYSSKPFRRCLMPLGFMPAHPSFYCKREVYMKYGGFNISYKIAADFENLLRLIYINNIKARYLPMDFVAMRQGGASTSGFKSHRQIMKDHLKALRTNGVKSNILLLSLRYAYKIWELAKFRAISLSLPAFLFPR